MRRILFAAAATLGLCSLSGPSTGQGTVPSLGLPIACTPGNDCFVQNYFDHDPGPAAKDHRCGSATYNGHDGIDIRVPTIAAQQRGVAVLASAAGVVRGVRDGQPDRVVASQSEVAGKECGNGVAISHPGGWETQYCHMARGSIVVRPGQNVAAGAKLGNVGLSGFTQFPHVHIGVRQGSTELDPFTGAAAACGTAGRPLWSSAVAARLAQSGPQVINAGFTTGGVQQAQIESESLPRAARGSPALVAYVRAIGLEGGDRLSLVLLGPDGREMRRNDVTLDRAKAQHLLFAGARPGAGGFPAGRYRLTYTVTRGGKTVLNRGVETTL